MNFLSVKPMALLLILVIVLSSFSQDRTPNTNEKSLQFAKNAEISSSATHSIFVWYRDGDTDYPISGASIIIEGTNNGTTTNSEGFGYIDASGNPSFPGNYVIHAVGFISLKVSYLSGTTNYSIRLAPIE